MGALTCVISTVHPNLVIRTLRWLLQHFEMWNVSQIRVIGERFGIMLLGGSIESPFKKKKKTLPQQDVVASYQLECLSRWSPSGREKKSFCSSMYVDSGGCVAFPPTPPLPAARWKMVHTRLMSLMLPSWVSGVAVRLTWACASQLSRAASTSSSSSSTHLRSSLSRDALFAAPVSSLRWMHT